MKMLYTWQPWNLSALLQRSYFIQSHA